MSDVLIKNMEMPKNYPFRLTLYPNGHVVEHTGYSVHGHYQAIELPPHGRLIDADLAIKNLDKYYCKECDNWNGIRCKTCEHYWAMQVLEDAPTVLEANNG